MDLDRAVTLTEERLAVEGGALSDLLRHFRDRISPVLIGDREWELILERAGQLPITMGALPFGFELPLHTEAPRADLGVSLASGTRTAAFFFGRARGGKPDETARVIERLFRRMDAEDSPLREIVGRKLMLEYDIGPARHDEGAVPGMFLRPGERPILGARGQVNDAGLVVDALAACVGWDLTGAERRNVERAYLAQPADTRMDSFGVFPSRSRAIRLAVMGFTSEREVSSYLEDTGWPGELAAVHAVISRFKERAQVVRSGVNIDVVEDGVGPTLGLTPSSSSGTRRALGTGSTASPIGNRSWAPSTKRTSWFRQRLPRLPTGSRHRQPCLRSRGVTSCYAGSITSNWSSREAGFARPKPMCSWCFPAQFPPRAGTHNARPTAGRR